NRPQDASVLNAIREYRQFLLVPKPPEQARVQVPRDAGVGKIDVGTMR
ncbi:pectate lyase, partial [Pseudomonas syringae pv. tagetis]